MRRSGLLASLLLGTLPLLAACAARADEVGTMFVHLGRGVPAVLYRPVHPGPKATIGVLVMHSNDDYLAAAPCTELSKRGYSVLCADNSTSKLAPGMDFSLDEALLDAKLAVRWLRRYPGIDKVVLLGHSGGGALMAAYQNIAENGVRACQDADKIYPCPDELAGLPPADGMVMLDSNYGLGGMMLLSLDPAVTDEASGRNLDPALNLFNPRNGFVPGHADYSPQFIRRFQAAVGQRNNRLVRRARAQLAAIEAGTATFADDQPFVVVGANDGAFNNKLFAQDPQLLSRTQQAWPLVRRDGSAVTGIVHTVRVPENDVSYTASFERGALKMTVRNFLAAYALRVGGDFGYGADGITGVDWNSSYGATAGNIRGVTVPLLALGMTGHWEFLASELIYDSAVRSRDRKLAFIEGASHHFVTCVPCEKTPGEFGDTLKTTFDYVDRWLARPRRFLGAGTVVGARP